MPLTNINPITPNGVANTLYTSNDIVASGGTPPYRLIPPILKGQGFNGLKFVRKLGTDDTFLLTGILDSASQGVNDLLDTNNPSNSIFNTNVTGSNTFLYGIRPARTCSPQMPSLFTTRQYRRFGTYISNIVLPIFPNTGNVDIQYYVNNWRITNIIDIDTTNDVPTIEAQLNANLSIQYVVPFGIGGTPISFVVNSFDGSGLDVTITYDGFDELLNNGLGIQNSQGIIFGDATIYSSPCVLTTTPGFAVYTGPPFNSSFFGGYLQDIASSIPGYNEMSVGEQVVGEAFITDNAPTNGNILKAWVTSVTPGVLFIPSGKWQVSFNGYRVYGGDRTTKLYAEFYKRDTLNVETLLGTSALSIALNLINSSDDKERVTLTANIGNIRLDGDELIVVKIIEQITGGTTDPTSITIGYGGDYIMANFTMPYDFGDTLDEITTITNAELNPYWISKIRITAQPWHIDGGWPLEGCPVSLLIEAIGDKLWCLDGVTMQYLVFNGFEQRFLTSRLMASMSGTQFLNPSDALILIDSLSVQEDITPWEFLQVTPVCQNFLITPNTLPNGNVGVPYNEQIATADGTPPYSFILNGGSLPPGWSLNQITGEVGGTTTQPGQYTFTIQVIDSKDCSCQCKTYTLTISTKKKRGISAPLTFCCKPEQFKEGICPPRLRTTNGNEYVNIGNGCYVIVKRRR